MPFSKIRLLAVLALLVAAGVISVLYVIPASAVHAAAPPPSALARLTLDRTPAALPVVAFADADGKRAMLASFRGRYVLLNLWATWCAPCVRELPQLAQLKAALPGLVVVTVNVGRENAADTKAFLGAHGAGSLPVYVDSDAALLRAFNLQGLPFTTLVEPSGREIAQATGPCEWAAPAAVAYLRALTSPAARAPS
jgi:thiol-disulfide isomerase/thioredoxin